jgi:hypothetical protein
MVMTEFKNAETRQLFTTDGDDDDQRGVLFVSHYAS